MGPTWSPSGSYRPQMGPMLAPWTLLSEWALWMDERFHPTLWCPCYYLSRLGLKCVYLCKMGRWCPNNYHFYKLIREIMVCAGCLSMFYRHKHVNLWPNVSRYHTLNFHKLFIRSLTMTGWFCKVGLYSVKVVSIDITIHHIYIWHQLVRSLMSVYIKYICVGKVTPRDSNGEQRESITVHMFREHKLALLLTFNITMMLLWYGNPFRITGHLRGESTGDGWICRKIGSVDNLSYFRLRWRNIE